MIAALLAVGLVLAVPVDAAVGIEPGTVEVGQPIAPDTDTVVGEVTVRNPGSQRSAYAMYAQEAPEGLPISVEWFTFEPSGFELDPGATQVITVRIRPDAGASPGRYTALLTAAITTSPDSPAAAKVSGAVATEASFVIEDNPPVDLVAASATGAVGGGAGGIPTWAWGIAALTLVVAVLSVSSALRQSQQSDHTDRSTTS